MAKNFNGNAKSFLSKPKTGFKKDFTVLGIPCTKKEFDSAKLQLKSARIKWFLYGLVPALLTQIIIHNW